MAGTLVRCPACGGDGIANGPPRTRCIRCEGSGMVITDFSEPQTQDGNPPVDQTADEQERQAAAFREAIERSEQRTDAAGFGSATRGIDQVLLRGSGDAVLGDAVHQPAHYQQVPGIECIDVTQHFNFNKGNAIKYVWRAGAKGNEIKDLRKAIQYCQFEIARLEGRPPHGTR